MNPALRLPEECAAMRQLHALLAEEQAALSAADAVACEALLPAKAALVAQLSELAAGRYQELGSLGHSADETGMRAWLATAMAQGAEDVGSLWQSLLAHTRDAHALNHLNGVLLQQLLTQNQLAMQQLRHGVSADIYGPGGQPHAIALRPARAVG